MCACVCMHVCVCVCVCGVCENYTPGFLASVKLTAPLTDMIVSKGTETHLDYSLLQSLKLEQKVLINFLYKS